MRSTGRYYKLNLSTQVVFVIGLGLTATLGAHTPAWPPFLYWFLVGLGYSGMLTVGLLALIAAAEHKYQAGITSASYTFRNTGTVIGITLSSVVFQNVIAAELWRRIGDVPDAADLIGSITRNIGDMTDLPPTLHGDVVDAYMVALHWVFLTLLGVGALGAVASLFIGEHKLHKTVARKPSQDGS